MFVDNTSNVFWNMIQKEKARKFTQRIAKTKIDLYDNSDMKTKRGSLFLEQQFNLTNNEDPMKIIEKLPTYSKITILQYLLKEMTSIKERFEDNKNDMLEKIKQNCYNYYKSIIGMKEVYDYCESNCPEKQLKYILVQNTKEKLEEKYDIIYKIIFILRNNNDIMLNIIKKCPPVSYDQLSDFLVNYFYENAIESTFTQEELLMIIYLILEEFILIDLPNEISEEGNKTKNDLNTTILYYIFRSLTRKADVRNFTCSILSESLLNLESLKDILSIETKVIINNFIQEKNQLNQSCVSNNKKFEANPASLKAPSFDEASTTISVEFSKTLSSPDYSNINDFKLEDFSYLDEIQEVEDKLNLDDIEINPIFAENSVTIDYLKERLEEYSQKNRKSIIVIAMTDYINMQIENIISQKSEIYSNIMKIKALKIYTKLNTKDNSETLIEKTIKNYNEITKFIDEVLIRLKENITSLPHILKSIIRIIQILSEKKYTSENVKNAEYQKLMVLSNFLMGNIILPLLSNPDFNGIVTTDVISRVTRDNLEIITKILYKSLSGQLFSNKTEPDYTIFNKYIIETLPKIFDIINCLDLQKNFNLSQSVQNLIKTSDLKGNPLRNINYNYFKETQENIQKQSICFSWLDLEILIDLFIIYKETDEEKYSKNAQIFDEFIQLKDYCTEQKDSSLSNFQMEFFLLEKINYNPKFKAEIENILEDNYLTLMTNKKKDNKEDEDKILLFKKCLVEVLSYVNKLHKENFNYFVQKNHELTINDNDILTLLFNNGINNKYKSIEFEGENSIKKNNSENNDFDALQDFKNKKMKTIDLKDLEEDENEDADFKDVIFPQIIDMVKYELSHNLDSEKAKRIVFSSSYLQIHIDDLPQKYKENNYCLLIMEIIKQHELIINELNFSIINQFYLKVRSGEKLNMIITSCYYQIKNFEKVICIEYLFDKLDLPCKLIVKKDWKGLINNVIYEPIENGESNIHSIQSFIDSFPNFRKFEKKVEDIIDLEEKIELDGVLNSYFKDLKNLIKKQEIIKRFPSEEFESIIYELENYILFKLYDKLFPEESTEKDKKLYKKCCRLSFVKPENLIKDKRMINEKLWETSMSLIEEMDNKFTPEDKVKNFGKAFAIVQNSITFCSGKNDLGIDDTISTLIYVILKARPKNLFSNSKYCQLFLNPELSKKQFGILMSQIEMIKNIIYDMKSKDLIGVSEEEFGQDEE